MREGESAARPELPLINALGPPPVQTSVARVSCRARALCSGVFGDTRVVEIVAPFEFGERGE